MTAQAQLRLIGVRCRDFLPWRSLHLPSGHGDHCPGVGTPDVPSALRVTLHNWRHGACVDYRDARGCSRPSCRTMLIGEVARSDVAQGTMPPSVQCEATLDLRLCVPNVNQGGDYHPTSYDLIHFVGLPAQNRPADRSVPLGIWYETALNPQPIAERSSTESPRHAPDRSHQAWSRLLRFCARITSRFL